MQPITDIAKTFNSQCLALAENLAGTNTSATVSNPGVQDKVSKAIQSFFEFLQHLPDTIAPMETRLTVLFEIDRGLAGIYGSRIFIPIENIHPVHKLLRDLAALWQRYYLISGLAQRGAINGEVVGVQNFYEEWIRAEQVGIKETEYDRIKQDIYILLQSSNNLNSTTKIQLFVLLGKILIALGLNDGVALEKLRQHQEEIESRKNRTPTVETSEIVLAFQILWEFGKTLNDTGIQRLAYSKYINFLAHQDDFLKQLFTAWGWYSENDYTLPIAKGDEISFKDRSVLFSSLANETVKLGVGHSYFELQEYKRRNPGLTTVFQPIPIFMFGNSGVGKSSYLTALAHDVLQMRGGRGLTLGRELQACYETVGEAWRSGLMTPTTDAQTYHFWEDLNVTGFSIYDYGGKETQPEMWEKQLEETLHNAKGLLFFIGPEDYLDPVKLRKRGHLFDSIIQYWSESNREVRHIPLGIVLTKCDLAFGEDLGEFQRTTLLPTRFQPALIECSCLKRNSKQPKEFKTALERLQDCITYDHCNNLHPLLQDVAENIVSCLDQFLERIIYNTYHYQVFFTSALPPRQQDDRIFPWGVQEPLQWIISILEKFHLRESLAIFKNDEKDVERGRNRIHDDLLKLQKKSEEIAQTQAELDRMWNKPQIFLPVLRDRIKFLEEKKRQAEQEFQGILQVYVKDAPEGNRSFGTQAVEQEILKSEQTLAAIREKRADYEHRLRIRQENK